MADGTHDGTQQGSAAPRDRPVVFRVGPGPGGTTLGPDTTMFPDPLSAEGTAARTSFATVPQPAPRWRRALSAAELSGFDGRCQVWAAMLFEADTWFRLQLRTGDPATERLEAVAGQVEVDGSKVGPVYVAVPLGSIDLPQPAGVAMEGWAERVAGSGGVSWGHVRLIQTTEPDAAAAAWGAVPLIGSAGAARSGVPVPTPAETPAPAARAGGRAGMRRGTSGALKAAAVAAAVAGVVGAGAGSVALKTTPPGERGLCAATVAGVDVRTATTAASAIPVHVGSTVKVSMRSTAPITGHRVDLEYGGIRVKLAEGTDTGRSFSDVVPVDRFARFGVGLYQIVGRTTGPGACQGAAFIKVTGGSPLSTAGGAGAAAGAAVGLAGLISVAMSAARRGGRAGKPILGSLSGLMAGTGVLVLLQQFAAVFPTKLIVIGALAGGWVFGALLVLALAPLSVRRAARAAA